jgi:hypothetical protein
MIHEPGPGDFFVSGGKAVLLGVLGGVAAGFIVTLIYLALR